MTPEKALQAGFHAAQAIISAKDGDALGAAAHAMDAVLELVPVGEAQRLLDEGTVTRLEAERQRLNDEKFPR